MSKSEFVRPDQESLEYRPESLPADVDLLMNSLIDFAKARGWIPNVSQDLRDFIDYSNNSDAENKIFFHNLSFSYNVDLDNSYTVIKIDTVLAQDMRGDRPTPSGLLSRINIRNIVRSEDNQGIIGLWVANLEFSKTGGLIYPKNRSIKILNPDLLSSVYLNLDADENKSVDLRMEHTDTPNKHLVYSEGKWVSDQDKQTLASYGIYDRVIERYSHDTMFALADAIARGKIEGNSFHQAQSQVNTILSGSRKKFPK